MEIGNQLEQQEDITKLFPKLIDSKFIGNNIGEFEESFEDLNNENPIPEKNTDTLSTKENLNSLSDAEKIATETLYAIQTEVNNSRVFNPAIDLNKVTGLLSPEMVKHGIAYDTKFRPKELEKVFLESTKQFKKNPLIKRFFADLLSLSVHVKQSLVDAGDRPTLKTPSMLLVEDLKEIMKTHTEFGGPQIVTVINETLAQQAQKKIEGQQQEQLPQQEKLAVAYKNESVPMG